MGIMNKIVLVLYYICFVLINGSYSAIDSNVVIKNVERNIDLSSQLVKVTYKIFLENDSKQNIPTFNFVLDTKERAYISYISGRDSTKKELKYTEAKSADGTTYIFQLTGNTGNPVVYIEAVFAKLLEPYPTKITQNEKQLIRYFGNVYFYTPYKTSSQKTTIQVGSRNVEYHTQVKPTSLSDTTISYGPYENISPFTKEELLVHYENNSPFLTVTRLERTIEVSHWGNIAIEETLDIVHSGAVLKGPFSRYDFQKDGRNSQGSVRSYKTILPAAATGVYYRDTNGNISTSAMRTLKDAVELDLRPRFPLFGGWKTHYTLGYNVPSFEYLFHTGENYLLKMRLIDHVFDDMQVDEIIVKIILPEGCTNLKLITPYSVTRSDDTLHYTYLDTFGRPVITFGKKNLVENHIHDFNLKYNFSKVMMLQEPLLVVGFLYILFVFVIIWMRLDFAIIKEKDLHYHKE